MSHLIFVQMHITHYRIVFFCAFRMHIFMFALIQCFQNKECVTEVEKIKRSALMIHYFWNLRMFLTVEHFFILFLFSQTVKHNFYYAAY